MKQIQASQQELTQIKTLIATISRSVELLNYDVDLEEERGRVHDIFNPEYPILARHLRTRRDNLNKTLAALRARIEEQSYRNRMAG
jgi:hypothetical protein